MQQQPLVTIVNYSHPITDSQKQQILSLMGHSPAGDPSELVEVVDVNVHFDPGELVGEKCAGLVRDTCDALAHKVGEIYKDAGIIVNLPGFSPLAAILLVALVSDYGSLPFLLMKSRKEASTVVYDVIAIVGY